MELRLNSGDVITIPDDCKAVIKDKIITVEKEVQEFKDGDFVALNNVGVKFLIIYIYKSKRGCSSTYYHAATYNVYCENHVSYSDWCVCDEARIATEEEKQFLINALHADGKDWDADKKQIVDYKCKPKVGETYYYIDLFLDVIDDIWSGDRMDDLVYTSGNCFKTEEEAQKYADKFSEILKCRKL